MEDRNSVWWKIVNLNPVLLRGAVVALVGLLGSLGILVAPGLPDNLVLVFTAILAIVQAIWTKPSVTPNARVAVAVPDPVNKPEEVVSGEAVTTATNVEIVEAARGEG